uniref:Purinergic receptor n=1 Tax=Lotharella globosa TaxID=91324 RepID=A0A7S3YSM7_9EUKA
MYLGGAHYRPDHQRYAGQTPARLAPQLASRRLLSPLMGLKYNTVRFAQIPNTMLALLHYALMLGIITYVSIVSVYMHKGYQTQDYVQGTATLKVKGTARSGDGKIYDDKDLIRPAMQPGELFITTNTWETSNQTRGTCSGDKEDGKCSDGCTTGVYSENGMTTGRCSSEGVYCEIEAWCPLENIDRHYTGNIMNGVGNWTVLLRSDVSFPKFGKSYSNAAAKVELGKNLFRVDEIVGATGYTYNDTASKGGIFNVDFHYDCDLDDKDECEPTVKISRVDKPGSASYGFNYRETEYVHSTDSNAVERNIVKRYGLRLIFTFSGQAGRFDFVQLLVTLGAGAGLLGVATLVCDIVINYFLDNERSEAYRKEIYEEIDYEGDREDEKRPMLKRLDCRTCQGNRKVKRLQEEKTGGTDVGDSSTFEVQDAKGQPRV